MTARSEDMGTTGVPTRSTGRDLAETRDQLEAWFRNTMSAASDLVLSEVTKPAGSGVANETLFVDATWTEAGQRRSGNFVVRVDSPEFLYKDVDIAVHAAMYEALHGLPGIPVPDVLGFEHDRSLLGERFFVMERLYGKVPGDTPPFHIEGWVHDLSVEQRHKLWRNGVEVMARMHQVDVARLPFLQHPERGRSGLEQDMEYWFDYGRWAAAGDEIPVIVAAEKWLRENLPANPDTALAWGDSRVGNLMYGQDGEVVAVFDWDMVSLAGAESDLAWWTIMDLFYTTSVGVPRLEGFPNNAAMIELWEELTGRKAQNMWFHHVYAAYRMAVILNRLGKLLGGAGAVPADVAEVMINHNGGIQFLATQLGLPYEGEITQPWPGVDA